MSAEHTQVLAFYEVIVTGILQSISETARVIGFRVRRLRSIDARRLRNVDIIVAHCGDAAWERLLNLCRPNAVCLRVSSVPRTTIHRPYRTLQKAVVLELAPAVRSISNADWARIIKVLADPQEIGTLIDTPFESPAWPFFLVIDLPRYTCSLAVMCQIYLDAPKKFARQITSGAWWREPFRHLVEGEKTTFSRALLNRVELELGRLSVVPDLIVIEELLQRIVDSRSRIRKKDVSQLFDLLRRSLYPR